MSETGDSIDPLHVSPPHTVRMADVGQGEMGNPNDNVAPPAPQGDDNEVIIGAGGDLAGTGGHLMMMGKKKVMMKTVTKHKEIQ